MIDQEKEETKVTLTSITVNNIDIESQEEFRTKIAVLILLLLADF